MKKIDFNFTTPKCAYCGKLAADIHELIGGKSNKKGNSNRDTCIKYHIQLPLCREHHSYFESKKKISFIMGCEILGIEGYSTYRAITERNAIDLQLIAEKCKKWYKKHYGIDIK